MNDYVSDIQENAKYLKCPEQMLGKGLNIPYNPTNSGVRKAMNSTHQSHALVLARGEIPYICTGMENEFGNYSSTILESDDDYYVIAKIPKFRHAPDHHYFLILRSKNSDTITCIERISYKFRSEVYGYMYNNSYMDNFQPGMSIDRGQVLRTSIGFDQYMNKTAGCNLNVAYMCDDRNMEDSLIISDVCSEKMRAHLVRVVKVVLNENDIPLNIYGNDVMYKIHPDVGEYVKDGILMAYRREKKEEAVYTHSTKMLQQLMMSDDKITVNGLVIDVNMYCNNIDNIQNNPYNQQFYAYYEDRIRFAREIVSVVGSLKSQGLNTTYDLEKLFDRCNDEVNCHRFMDKKVFSNITVEFTILENRKFDVGDKGANRYGGKGVVSTVLPQHMMPRLANGEYIDMIMNNSTMYNRENAAQIFETSLNYISANIIHYIKKNGLDAEDSLGLILKFLDAVSPLEANEMRASTKKLTKYELEYFVSSVVDVGVIPISNLPISENMNIDKLASIYEIFPWIQQEYLKVPIKDSNGNIRYVNTRRKMVAGKQYILRLKQFAEEKFSATSLSSTNIKNENAKSKASKNYRELYPNTPIKFGNMEADDINHLGVEVAITTLLIHSLSPFARRLVEEAYTGDPYNLDVRLHSKAKNRSVEVINARLKTMGYRMYFKKKKKKIPAAITVPAVAFFDGPKGVAPSIRFVGDNFDYEAYCGLLEDIKNLRDRASVLFKTIKFI